MQRVLASILLAISLVFPTSASAFDAIVAFGDSLTDTGNEPAEPYLHYNGRWSNGPLWIEYLSERLGFPYEPANNFANSGAQCDDAWRQVTNYIAAPVGDISETLFVVWAGGNDFLQEYEEHWFDDAGWAAQVTYSVAHLSEAVILLREKGAKHILVPNTVDVTTIPLLNRLPNLLRDYLRGKVKRFNNELAKSLNTLQATYPDITLYRCDVYAGENLLLKKYKAYGFKERKIDALTDPRFTDKSFDGRGAKHVFWDPIHPTTKAHALIADWFYIAVGSPVPAS